MLSDQLVEPGHRLCSLRVADHGRPLVLPEVKIAARQLLKLVGVVGHNLTIGGSINRWLSPSATAKPMRSRHLSEAKRLSKA